MKRFFAVVGFSFLLSLLLLNNIIPDSAFVFLVVSLSVLAALLLVRSFKRKNEIICVLLSFALASVSFMLFNKLVYKPQLCFSGEVHNIEATVMDYPTISSGGNYSYLVRTKNIDGERQNIKMRFYCPYDISAEPYDEVSFTSAPFVPGENNSDILSYFKGKGVFLGAYTKDDIFITKPSEKPLISFFCLRKGVSEKTLRRNLPGDLGEFSVSLLFGDKTYLSDEIKDNFSVSGLSHITAVSGLHLSLWVMGLYAVLKKLKVKEKIASALCIAASVSLVFFCAFSVSVIRAAVMMTIYFSASFFRRRPDSLNSLGFAAFLICALNPFSVCDVSFLLSFFATLGIITGVSLFPRAFHGEKNRNILNRLKGYFLSVSLVCVFASLFTLPVLIRYFSSVGTFVVLGNLAVSFVLPVCLLLSGVLSLSGNVSFVAYPVKSALVPIENYIFTVTENIASLPHSSFASGSDAFRLYFPLITISLFFVFYCMRRRKIGPCAVLAAFSLITVTVS